MKVKKTLHAHHNEFHPMQNPKPLRAANAIVGVAT
jgi:hypothetical protein